ncbi:Fe-S cluster assembly protein HesB [Arthrobacter sp. 7749]|uniref:Adenine DNA glycosylase n=2 Tax=Paeniglutamicibacter terrestris TaxID=2723403 RepID=A0ABX1G4Y3_9MICC|nr:Fe-S cluster assembly protein HesB [Arthrobacter sp. 7749]NKG21299.1 A/G-specific adenine glycosylase [Paeniglutamicibacter terrestris]
MVSEFMLQQTPVVRVLPVWETWMKRWPTPAALAAEPVSEALKAWGRLGYPRRALRLHAAATVITDEFDGEVPATQEQLLALPGVGTYTAAAIACFAFNVPAVVVDTNIRRVHARLVSGQALPEQSQTAGELALAARLMPAVSSADNADAQLANAWNIAVMELGALVCTARSPRCEDCPVINQCAWIAAGRPEPHYKPKGQPWHGTDRQVRGAMMAVLRHTPAPVQRADLLGTVDLTAASQAAIELNPAREASPDHRAWVELHALEAPAEQRVRALDSLLADGLAQQGATGIQLPR